MWAKHKQHRQQIHPQQQHQQQKSNTTDIYSIFAVFDAYSTVIVTACLRLSTVYVITWANNTSTINHNNQNNQQQSATINNNQQQSTTINNNQQQSLITTRHINVSKTISKKKKNATSHNTAIRYPRPGISSTETTQRLMINNIVAIINVQWSNNMVITIAIISAINQSINNQRQSTIIHNTTWSYHSYHYCQEAQAQLYMFCLVSLELHCCCCCCCCWYYSCWCCCCYCNCNDLFVIVVAVVDSNLVVHNGHLVFCFVYSQL